MKNLFLIFAALAVSGLAGCASQPKKPQPQPKMNYAAFAADDLLIGDERRALSYCLADDHPDECMSKAREIAKSKKDKQERWKKAHETFGDALSESLSKGTLNLLLILLMSMMPMQFFNLPLFSSCRLQKESDTNSKLMNKMA